MSVPLVLRSATVLVVTLVPVTPVFAGKPYSHRAPRHSSQCIRAYRYDQHAGATVASIIAIAPESEPVEISSLGPPMADGNQQPIWRKAFYTNRLAIDADHVTLGRIAVSLYSDGQFVGSGVLGFDGGPDGALQGANVAIQVRAYAGAPHHPGGLGNMRLLWQTRQQYWIERGQSRAISLFPANCLGTDSRPGAVDQLIRAPSEEPPSVLIRSQFTEITHLEIVLEKLHDR